MKKILPLVIVLVMSSSVFAQTIPTLPKEWVGEVSGTAIGVTHQLNPNQGNKDWNTYDVRRTITIIRQEGRRLELLIKSANGQNRWVGTLSKNGKRLEVVSKNNSFSFTLAGATLSGCGSGHGDMVSFDGWLNNYAALCHDFTAVK